MKENYLETNLNLVLLGRTGAGKSASGNTILGRQAFKSIRSSRSVTRDVAVESGTVGGIPVTVYDTPGLFDTEQSEEEIQQIYENVLQKCESGPCVFLLVIKADRFTEEERKTVEKIEKLLGENRLKKTWILFTGGDQLKEDNMTIKEFIEGTEALEKLVQKYDQRYHVFNNRIKGSSNQARRLLLENILQISSGLTATEGGRLPRHKPDIRNNASDEQQTPVSSLSSRRIVLLGKTGVGKSGAGNTILGQREFKSVIRMSSVTHKCSEAHATVSGRSVSVVDTPGFFDTQMKPEDLVMEIARSVYISSPGPHAFLIVFPVNMRYTEDEQQIPQMIEMMFGEEVLKYSIILFTHGDLLDGESVEELIEENSGLRDLVDQCGGRFHIFNNKDVNNREQVKDLLKKIDSMIEQNGGGHYSNQMYEDAQRFRREEEEERQREEEERKQQEEKQIQEEIERVRRETEEKIRGEMKVKAERQSEEQRKQEEQRQEVIERERKETERRIRAEFEAQQKSNQESKQKPAETSSWFKQFFYKYQKYFYIAIRVVVVIAGAVVGGAVGAVVGGAVDAVVGGAVGAVVGGAVGAVVGGAVGAVVGGAVGAAVGGAVGAVAAVNSK